MSPAAASDARVRALLDERTAMLARRGIGQARREATRAFLVCALGSERCGLPLGQVASVLPGKSCTALPGAPAGLRGIVALSGGIVTVVDLAAALGLSTVEGSEAAGGHLVRLRSLEPPVALAVERVLGIAQVAASLESGAEAGRAGSLGGEAVSGYAPPGSDAAGGIGEGFSLIDLPRLLRRFLP